MAWLRTICGSPARGLMLAAVLVLGRQAISAQERRSDPVEDLKRTLASNNDRAKRAAELSARLNNLRSLRDLHQALFLRQWRDHDENPAIAAVDQKYRAEIGQRFEQAIRPVLKNADRSMRAKALEMLAGVAAAQPEGCDPCLLMPGLAADLADMTRQGQAGLREAAGHALARWHADPEVSVPALGTLLVTGNASERSASASDLALVIDECFRLIEIQNTPKERMIAQRRFIQAARGAVPAFGLALKEREPEVRRLCLTGLKTVMRSAMSLIQAPQDIQETESGRRRQIEEDLTAFLSLLRQCNEQGVRLTPALLDSEISVRQEALLAVQEMATLRLEWSRQAAGTPIPADPLQAGLTAVVPALAKNVGHEDVTIRRTSLEVIELLGSLGNSTASALVKALGDEDRYVRWSAARILGRLAPLASEQAVPALARLVADPDPGLALVAVTALDRYGPAARNALPALIARIHAQDTDLRAAIVHAVGIWGRDSESVMKEVKAALKDPCESVRLAASQALEQAKIQRPEPAGIHSYHRPAQTPKKTEQP